MKGGFLSTCGTSCPAGYYVESLKRTSLNCRNEFKNNRVNCRQVSGDFFSMCGRDLLSGGRLCVGPEIGSPQLRGRRVQEQPLDCQKVSGGSSSNAAPPARRLDYVNALKADSLNRPNEFQNNRVECLQVKGGSLSTCGTSCPTGYYVNALKADPLDCSGSLFKNNRVDCRQVSGDSFSMCGTSCPAGYSVSALKSDPLNGSGDCSRTTECIARR